MLPEGITSSEVDLFPQLWLARYYHLDKDDAQARQILRSLVQVVIELLSDEDDSNDKDAFKKARSVFIAFDDEKNALAALALEAIADRFSPDTEHEWMLGLSCATCAQSWDIGSEMLICKHCINVHLDDKCMTKLKEGTLDRNICHPDHDFIRVPKLEWDGDWLGSVPKGMVPWGDLIISLDEWKQEIRKSYIDSKA